MWPARWLVILALWLTACSSGPKAAAPPANFPDLGAFTAVDSDDPKSTSNTFVTTDQIDCVLDFGPQRAIVCSGDIPGLPSSVTGSGCPSVHKAAGAGADSPYSFERSGPDCASSRAMPLVAGRKFVGKNGTCAVAKGGLVACIDADYKHGFVLQPSGSWAF